MTLPSSLKNPALGVWNGEFLDPDLENQFRLDTARDWAKQAGWVSMVGGVFFLAGFWVDYVTLGVNHTSLVLLLIRAVFAVIALCWGWHIRKSDNPRAVDTFAALVLMACVIATIFIIYSTPVPSVRHSLTVFVFIIVFFVFVPTRIWINALPTGILSIAFLIVSRMTMETPVPIMVMIVLYVFLGNILGWIATVHLHRLRRMQWFNLQAERQAQARLLEEVQERKQAEESLRQLASGVAHNFNNSLMAITSNLQAAQSMLRKDGENAAARGFLNNAWQSAASGREVAQRLTRAVVGDNDAQRENGMVELGELIGQAQGIAWLTWSRNDRTVDYSQDIEPDLWVVANRGELTEVFLNLFKNSLEALEEGGQVHVAAGKKATSIVIEVQDDGPGISPELQQRLFKPFASDKGVRGQGLGLAVSRGILHSLDGGITCRSQLGRGTTMIIELPAAEKSAAKAPEESSDEIHLRGENRRVLLVEDEGLVALGVSAILRQAGYRVWQATDLAEAERTLAEAEPELVLCDFGLPDGNAWDIYQATSHWSVDSGHPEPAFIVLTGWSEAQLAGDPGLFDFEPFAWLQKPVDKQELLDVLGRALSSLEPTASD
jgi:signal transduction histidine kinase/CheY-like chemotaxis protein